MTTTLFIFSFCSDDLIVEEPAGESTALIEETGTPLTKAGSNFKFGVAGHAIGTPPYINTPPQEQMKLLKSMGMNIYRFSVLTMSDGRSTVPYRFDPFVKAARAAGVTLLPMLHHRTLDFSVSNTESYHRGKKIGRNFARQYKDIFTYYELGNELDNKCIIKGSSGQSRAHYNIKKWKTIAAYLKGMNAGIKLEDPTAKTMINASWLHYAFLEMLEDHGVTFDIIACHWYSEMESTAKKKPYYIDDITKKLSEKFNKPIWFTEINARPQDVHDMELRQDSFLKSFIAKAKRNPQVEAVIIYELFDEPHKNHYMESNYGIVKWKTRYTSWALKKAAQNLTNSN